METDSVVVYGEDNNEFKSYYVVWKRWMVRTERKDGRKFKSYYVVWKQICPNRFKCGVMSLNRTM